VLSPSTAALDRIEKMPIYAANGVAWAWLIDPLLQTLEVFRLEGTSWMLAGTHRSSAMIRAEPFEAIEIDIGALWTPPSQ